MINSKKKGNSFELKVAKQLSEWSGEKFIRTPMSGAIHHFNDKRVVSDIVAPLSLGEWPFSIECKNVMYDWEFAGIIEGKSTFWKHWGQCWVDSQREELLPMLVFTKNYRNTYVAITSEDYRRLGVSLDSYIIVRLEEWDLSVFRFDELLEKITCEELLSRSLLDK